MVIPLLPFYALRFGASGSALGLLLATYSLAQLFASPLLGRLSDRLGRKPVILASLGVSSASYLILGAASSLPWLFLARALAGAMAGNIAAAQAYVADVSAPEDRARGMGTIGAAFGLGFVLGPALGGGLARVSLRVPALAASFLSLSALLWTALALPEPSARSKGNDPPGEPFLEVLRRPGTRRLLLSFFALTLSFTALEAVFALLARERLGFGAEETGLSLALAGLVTVLVQGAGMRRLSARPGPRVLAPLGALVLGFFLVALGLSRSLTFLLLSLSGAALGQGLYSPALLALLSLAGERGHGGRMGLAQSASGLARVLGPPLAGWGFDFLGGTYLYLAAGLLAGLAGLLLFRAPERESGLHSTP